MSLHCPRFVLGGAHSGVGKTSVSVAVMGALRERGIHVQPYKVGPDYVDSAFHAFVTGTPSRNLDAWIVASEDLRKMFARTAPAQGSGMSVIEGVMGLFDGNGTTSEGGTAHVAKVLSAPVVLVVNGEGIARSLGALVCGYRDFDAELNLSGVIINRLSGEKHYSLLKRIVEEDTGLRCYGYLPKRPEVELAHRPLGLVPPSEAEGMRAKIDALAALASETIDLDGLLALADGAPALEAEAEKNERIAAVRIGILRDAAFSAYYEDNLDLLSELGAEFVFFDALHSAALPENLNGLYIGGGSPEVFARELSENTSLKAEIRHALDRGLPVYAEGAGVTYLCRRLIDANGDAFDMTGFLDCDAAVTKRLPNFGHVSVTLGLDTPLGPRGATYRANEFHRLELRPLEAQSGAYIAEKPNGLSWRGGIVKKNTFASLVQIHFYANKQLARNFIESCAAFTDLI